ncbi:MAG: site-specific integrase [Acidipropionibacterium jensenii]|uniref:tyrosine-type recombinase/integrase n=1 Tax=Acidipropionibacterium jensenii TaxID=1749 RepID=UPI0026476B42|nr:site-specific integrase [Acidipropionibacterium jensenii]MDN6440472.1 site-specific integrase [Acidipropionibacterium jensenii]
MSVQRRPKKGQPLPDGWKKPKWVVRYRDPAGKEHSKTFDTQAAAKDFDADQAAKLTRGTWIDPADEKTTLAQLVDEWVEQTNNTGTRGVRAGFRTNLGDLEDMPIGRIRASHVTVWATALHRGRPWKNGAPLSDTTVGMHISRLKGVFARAVEDGLIARSPVPSRLKASILQDREITEREVPTFAQVKTMCAVADTGGEFADTRLEEVCGRQKLRPSPWLAMTIRLGVDTGLRAGELSGLQWRDVDLTGRTVRVERQCIKKLGVCGGLKTKRSRRVVPLSRAMVRELKGWAKDRGPEDTVVPGSRGSGTSSIHLSQMMRVLGAVVGLDDRLWRFHGLRHLYASSMLQAGEPITTVAALIGDSVPTTSRVYAHWLPGAQDAARSSVEFLAGSVRDDAPILRVVDGGSGRSAG